MAAANVPQDDSIGADRVDADVPASNDALDQPVGDDTVESAPVGSPALAFLKYTGLRLAIFVVVAAVFYALGLRSIFVNMLASLLVSGLISLVALERFRIDAGRSLEDRGGLKNPFSGVRERIDAATRAEDAADDAERGLPPQQ